MGLQTRPQPTLFWEETSGTPRPMIGFESGEDNSEHNSMNHVILSAQGEFDTGLIIAKLGDPSRRNISLFLKQFGPARYL